MLFTCFTHIIEQKVTKLKEFDQSNYLLEEVNNGMYEDYKGTSDFKKLIKIAKDYYDRYSLELKTYWQHRGSKGQHSRGNQAQYREAIEEVTRAIEYLLTSLQK